MSEAYEETIEGERLPRKAPGARHALICARLHRAMQASVADFISAQLLKPRTQISLASDTVLCPDLALITTQTKKVWLAAEIVSSDDHKMDTVIKKQIYEDMRIPRLWMIDPRYDNVEIYHSSEYGLMLKCILAGSEVLSEKLIPEFQITIADLFQGNGVGR